MPDNRQVQSNGVVSNASNSSADNLEDAIRRLNIQITDTQEGGAVGNMCQYPDRPGEPDCLFYLKTGMCGYGNNCRFNHPAHAGQGVQPYEDDLPERVGQPDCVYYLKNGTCKYGSGCKYHHPRDRHGAGPVSLNILGLPIRQDEKPCPFYMKTASCKFGAACKFHHPQPAAAGAIPLLGSADYGSVGSAVVPSPGVYYAGGMPALSHPRAPYISSPHSQGLQTYMPSLVPSQAIAAAHGWNTYLGYVSPVSSLSVLGSNLVYNSNNLDESGPTGLGSMLSMSISHLPERPDQPECRHFMSTGSCKYGSDCKYHHPRERITQSPTYTLGPLGLPLRPGQPVCSHYSSYGRCKYGPTCKFDHPLAGHPYNYYGWSFPSYSAYDSSFLPYQKNSPTFLSSEAFSKSSKVHDWVTKSEAAGHKTQNMDTGAPENITVKAGSPPHPLPASSELAHDQSDQ